jgi:hypothetical protein
MMVAMPVYDGGMAIVVSMGRKKLECPFGV